MLHILLGAVLRQVLCSIFCLLQGCLCVMRACTSASDSTCGPGSWCALSVLCWNLSMLAGA